MNEPLFGFSQFTTWPWSFERDLEGYRRHGASVIEICEFKLAHESYGEQLRALQESGLRAASVQAHCHSIFIDSMYTRMTQTSDRIEAIERAIEMSAPYLPPGTPFIVITGKAPDGNLRHVREKSVEALKRLGDFAGTHGMKIAFETLNPVNLHTDTAVWGLDQGLELIDAVAHPNVGLCLDTWNVFMTPNLEDLIAQCGSRLLVVQLSDWRTPRSNADRYCLGDGTIRLDRILRAIRATGYQGPWVVEILSDFSLEDSLWKRDLDDVLTSNARAFQELWKASAPGDQTERPSTVKATTSWASR